MLADPKHAEDIRQRDVPHEGVKDLGHPREGVARREDGGQEMNAADSTECRADAKYLDLERVDTQ